MNGQPDRLQTLFESPKLKAVTQRNLPVYGPYHASHLYKNVSGDESVIEEIVCAKLGFQNITLALPLITVAGTFSAGDDSRIVLRNLVKHILTERYDVQDLVKSCGESLAQSGQSRLEVHLLGFSRYLETLAKCFESLVGQPNVSFQTYDGISLPSETETTSRTSRRLKLAIVGMAGRFPNAANHEKFWDLLEGGVDLHRQV